jgi:hypothetical protein
MAWLVSLLINAVSHLPVSVLLMNQFKERFDEGKFFLRDTMLSGFMWDAVKASRMSQ